MTNATGRGGSMVSRIARTLITNGYRIDACERPAQNTVLLSVARRDVLGGEAKSVLLFALSIGRPLVTRLTNTAANYGGSAVVITLGPSFRLPASVFQTTATEFFRILGGEVRTDRIIVPELAKILNALGHGQVPLPLHGNADRLLEEYCQDCWSYLLESPVRRFGQERAFERLPDGLILARNQFNVCFDAKAYSKGFHPSSKDMRAFTEYVNDFNDRYASFVGPISVFVVVSGSFPKTTSAITEKSNELLIAVRTPMVFVTSKQLAQTIELIRPYSRMRGALDWRKILVPPLFDLARLKNELNRVRRDKVI